MSRGTHGISVAQAQAVAKIVYGKYGALITIDGPIADTKCIRVRWRQSAGGQGDEQGYMRGLLYLDRKGNPVKWDSLRDRPRQTPSGRLLAA